MGKRTIFMHARIPDYIFALLVSTRPELFKPDEPGVFKKNALSNYIARLVLRDVRGHNATLSNDETPSENEDRSPSSDNHQRDTNL